MVRNTQTNFEETAAYKSLLYSHLEQEVIKIQYITSSMIYEYQITLSCGNHFYMRHEVGCNLLIELYRIM